RQDPSAPADFPACLDTGPSTQSRSPAMSIRPPMEKMMRRLVPLLIASLVACETPELRRTRAEADSLRSQVAALAAELDEIKYGAGRLLERARSDLQAGNYKSAIDAAGLLLSKHPESPEAEDARKILAVAERSLAEEEAKRQREKAAKER